jgi:uncharacterized protein YqgV (UPF0045/DUF77 family)
VDIAVEISMYPLTEGYLEPIQLFIDALRANEHLHVATNTMSTQVLGEYEEVWAALQKAMRQSMEAGPRAVFVTKFLPREPL